MKIRKLSNIIFFAVTLVVFSAGTIFTFVHRYNPKAEIISRDNILALAAGCFLTVGELAFIFLHGLLDARDLWRRVVAYVLSLLLICTISYATYTEAKSFMEEGNLRVKTDAISKLSQDQQEKAQTSGERRYAMKTGQNTLDKTLQGMKTESFAPFAINFVMGLFAIITGTLIQPREPWRRKQGNQMTTQVRARAQQKIGYVPEGARAYDNGRGDALLIKHGREYLGTIPKEKMEKDQSV